MDDPSAGDATGPDAPAPVPAYAIYPPVPPAARFKRRERRVSQRVTLYTVDVEERRLRASAPVRALADVTAGAPADRPVYVLGEVGVWGTFTSPAGPHRGHTLLVRKVRRRGGDRPGRVGVIECVRCRVRWSVFEHDDPAGDPYRWRPAEADR